MESFMNYMKFKRVQIDKGWVVMYFKNRGAKNVVSKNKERKSFRYTVVDVSDDEIKDIEKKLRFGEVV
jgi:archaellin